MTGLGLLVIFGWFSESEKILQIFPFAAPMQFNTALCFVFSGIGASFLLFKKKRWAFFFSFPPLVFGTLTLLQYIANVNFGIDEIFMDHFITTSTSHPGRMAPNTAICFVLTGMALLFGARDGSRSLLATFILAGLIGPLSFGAILGYLLNVEVSYGWGSLTRMAIHTAIGFLLLSFSLVCWRWEKQGLEHPLQDKKLSLMLGVSTFILFICLGLSFREREWERFHDSLDLRADILKKQIDVSMRNKREGLARMASRLETGEKLTVWEKDAYHYVHDFYGVKGYFWMSLEEKKVNRIGPDPDLLRKAFDNLRPKIEGLEPIQKKESHRFWLEDLGLHEEGLATLIPIFTGQKLKGTLVEIWAFDGFFQSVWKITAGSGVFLVRDGERLLFSSNEERDDVPFFFTKEFAIPLADSDLTGVLKVSDRDVDAYFTWLPWIIFFSGFILSVLFSLVLFYFQKYLGLLKDFQRQTTTLEKEIKGREIREKEIISLNKRLEKQKDQLLAANEEMKAFSYSVSHDLRTPLRGMDGFGLALSEDYGDKLDEKGREYIQRIRNAASKMGRLIDDLLALSRLSQREMKWESFDLFELAKEVVEDLKTVKDLSAYQVDMKGEAWVLADKNLIRVALENLIGNAVKYSQKEKSPKIEFGLEKKSDGNGVFFVKDNGVGFDMAYAGKLFGAFQRLHGVNEFEGTGIGLATVKRVLTLHGGTIWAEAKPGEGAKFLFNLQLSEDKN